MFLVLLIHYIPFRGKPTPETISQDLIPTLFNLELRSLCFVCVNCFILISGYYGIKWKLRSFCNLIFQFVFWSVLCTLVVMAVQSNCSLAFAAEAFKHDIIGRWFVESYIGLYVFAPILNMFVKNTTTKDFARVIGAYYVFSTIWGWMGKSPDINEGMSVISLVGLYLIGAFIRKVDFKWLSMNRWIYLFSYLGIGFALVAFSAIALKLGVNKSLYGYLNPLVIVESVCLFLFFLKINIGYIKWVNWISASVFSVYLCHTGKVAYPYYQDVCRYIEANFTYSFFIGIGFLVILFITIVLIDKLTREFLWNWILKLI